MGRVPTGEVGGNCPAHLRKTLIPHNNRCHNPMEDVFWIGGGQWVGKTSVAIRLARRHGLQFYPYEASPPEPARTRKATTGSAVGHTPRRSCDVRGCGDRTKDTQAVAGDRPAASARFRAGTRSHPRGRASIAFPHCRARRGRAPRRETRAAAASRRAALRPVLCIWSLLRKMDRQPLSVQVYGVESKRL